MGYISDAVNNAMLAANARKCKFVKMRQSSLFNFFKKPCTDDQLDTRLTTGQEDVSPSSSPSVSRTPSAQLAAPVVETELRDAEMA